MGDNEGRESWAPYLRQSAYKAEGVGFEPTSRLTTANGFRDRRGFTLYPCKSECSGFSYANSRASFGDLDIGEQPIGLRVQAPHPACHHQLVLVPFAQTRSRRYGAITSRPIRSLVIVKSHLRSTVPPGKLPVNRAVTRYRPAPSSSQSRTSVA